MFVCVLTFTFSYECVCFLPALTAHHGAPAEHCCISASLGLSLRSSERPDPAGNGLGPENRKNGERIGMEEDLGDTQKNGDKVTEGAQGGKE